MVPPEARGMSSENSAAQAGGAQSPDFTVPGSRLRKEQLSVISPSIVLALHQRRQERDFVYPPSEIFKPTELNKNQTKDTTIDILKSNLPSSWGVNWETTPPDIVREILIDACIESKNILSLKKSYEFLNGKTLRSLEKYVQEETNEQDVVMKLLVDLSLVPVDDAEIQEVTAIIDASSKKRLKKNFSKDTDGDANKKAQALASDTKARTAESSGLAQSGESPDGDVDSVVFEPDEVLPYPSVDEIDAFIAGLDPQKQGDVARWTEHLRETIAARLSHKQQNLGGLSAKLWSAMKTVQTEKVNGFMLDTLLKRRIHEDLDKLRKSETTEKKTASARAKRPLNSRSPKKEPSSKGTSPRATSPAREVPHKAKQRDADSQQEAMHNERHAALKEIDALVTQIVERAGDPDLARHVEIMEAYYRLISENEQLPRDQRAIIRIPEEVMPSLTYLVRKNVGKQPLNGILHAAVQREFDDRNASKSQPPDQAEGSVAGVVFDKDSGVVAPASREVPQELRAAPTPQETSDQGVTQRRYKWEQMPKEEITAEIDRRIREAMAIPGAKLTINYLRETGYNPIAWAIMRFDDINEVATRLGIDRSSYSRRPRKRRGEEEQVTQVDEEVSGVDTTKTIEKVLPHSSVASVVVPEEESGGRYHALKRIDAFVAARRDPILMARVAQVENYLRLIATNQRLPQEERVEIDMPNEVLDALDYLQLIPIGKKGFTVALREAIEGELADMHGTGNAIKEGDWEPLESTSRVFVPVQVEVISLKSRAHPSAVSEPPQETLPDAEEVEDKKAEPEKVIYKSHEERENAEVRQRAREELLLKAKKLRTANGGLLKYGDLQKAGLITQNLNGLFNEGEETFLEILGVRKPEGIVLTSPVQPGEQTPVTVDIYSTVPSRDLLKNIVDGKEDWEYAARCREKEKNPEDFFVQGEEQNKEKIYCNPCLVKGHCLAYALKKNMEFGVWGGRTERERNALLRNAGSRIAEAQGIEKGDMEQMDWANLLLKLGKTVAPQMAEKVKESGEAYLREKYSL